MNSTMAIRTFDGETVTPPIENLKNATRSDAMTSPVSTLHGASNRRMPKPSRSSRPTPPIKTPNCSSDRRDTPTVAWKVFEARPLAENSWLDPSSVRVSNRLSVGMTIAAQTICSARNQAKAR
jgi:hypothetical protein